jgi:hypothetical protein
MQRWRRTESDEESEDAIEDAFHRRGDAEFGCGARHGLVTLYALERTRRFARQKAPLRKTIESLRQGRFLWPPALDQGREPKAES